MKYLCLILFSSLIVSSIQDDLSRTTTTEKVSDTKVNFETEFFKILTNERKEENSINKLQNEITYQKNEPNFRDIFIKGDDKIGDIKKYRTQPHSFKCSDRFKCAFTIQVLPVSNTDQLQVLFLSD